MPEPSQALVVAGHGSHLNPESSTPIFEHANRIRERNLFDEVQEAFWKEEPAFREVLRTLDSDEIYVVPAFMSNGYFANRVIPRELRIADGWKPETDGQVHYSEPVGTHDSMTDVIIKRAETVTENPSVGTGTGLAVVGHGTERHEDSNASTNAHAAAIRARDRFDEVRALFMDEPPYIDDVTDHFETDDIVVVPLFVADGYHTREDIPEDMGLTDDYRDGYDIPTTIGGHRIWYSGAVGTEPLLADVILERAAEAGATIDQDRTTRATKPTPGA